MYIIVSSLLFREPFEGIGLHPQASPALRTNELSLVTYFTSFYPTCLCHSSTWYTQFRFSNPDCLGSPEIVLSAHKIHHASHSVTPLPLLAPVHVACHSHCCHLFTARKLSPSIPLTLGLLPSHITLLFERCCWYSWSSKFPSLIYNWSTFFGYQSQVFSWERNSITFTSSFACCFPQILTTEESRKYPHSCNYLMWIKSWRLLEYYCLHHNVWLQSFIWGWSPTVKSTTFLEILMMVYMK